MTGFQVNAKGEKNLMAAPENGELVAWSVRLSKPKASQREFFGKFYKDEELGTEPTARIAVLKPPEEGNEYLLKAQGPVVELSDDLGTKPLYTLDEPIPIKKGDIIALTVPTWIPNFAVDLSNKNVWRASREKGACEDSNDIKKGRRTRRSARSAPTAAPTARPGSSTPRTTSRPSPRLVADLRVLLAGLLELLRGAARRWRDVVLLAVLRRRRGLASGGWGGLRR